MIFTIDEKLMTKHKLSLKETLLLATIKTAPGTLDDAFLKLSKRGIITKRGRQYLVEASWVETMGKIIADGDLRLRNLAEEMKKCYPEGKMPGTAFYYRCNTREVAAKLAKFLRNNGDYPDEEIIDATKRFVASFNGNYKYLPLLKYFISKNKNVMGEDGTQHVTEVSLLASYLENKDGTPDMQNNDEWLMTARN